MHASWSDFLISSTSEHALILDIHTHLRLWGVTFRQSCGVVKVCCWHFYSFLYLLHLLEVRLSAFHLKPWAILCSNFFFFCLKKRYSAVHFSSVTQSCPTLCNPMDCSMPGFPVHCQLPELAQTHVHRVGNAIQPSHPLVTSFSFCLDWSKRVPASGSFPVSQFFVSAGQSIEFQLQHQSFQWIFRTDFL